MATVAWLSKSTNDILHYRDHSNKQYYLNSIFLWLLFVTLYSVKMVLTFESIYEICKYDNSNESSQALQYRILLK